MPGGCLVIAVGGFNSAIDKLATLGRLAVGEVTRFDEVRPLPGGKGLHVAMACGALGTPATLVGLTDPASRPLFERAMDDVHGEFVGIDAGQPIRTCLAIRDADGRTTELLEPGPSVSRGRSEQLRHAFLTAAASASHAALCGSLPPGLAVDLYARLVREAGAAKVALDTSGEALARGLAAGPLLVKPNRDEAARLVGWQIETSEQAIEAAARIADRGPRIVLLSLGGEGAVLYSDGRAHHVRGPAIEARNAVGAGDCQLAGFLVALARGWPIEASARYAVACGTAKCLDPRTGALRPDDVDRIAPAVTLVAA